MSQRLRGRLARADLSVIGTWKDEIRQDDQAVAEYAAAGLDIQKDVVDRCPTRCMSGTERPAQLSKTASACAACTASTSCRKRCGPAKKPAPPS